MRNKKITVVVPVLPGTKEIKSIKTLEHIDYPKDKIELLVSEGKNPSLQRNKAIDSSEGEIIIFFDDDSEIPADYIKKTQKHYQNHEIDGVGGPVETSKDDSYLQKCFGYVIGSYFATQDMSKKFKGTGKPRLATEKELILCNFSIRKESLGKYRFDERLYPNEENELYNRLLSDGKKLLYDPTLKVHRKQRKNPYLFSKQFFRYGHGRIEHLLIRPKSLTPVFLIPPLFLIYVAISAIFATKLPTAFYIPLGAYAVLAIGSSAKIALEEKKPSTMLITPLLFLVVHLSYGLGMLSSLLSFRKTKTSKEIRLRKIKLQ